METRKSIILKILLDLFCMLLVFTPWIVLHSGVKPAQRGFFCNDASLRYPYHPTTIDSLIVTFVGMGSTIIIVCVTEYVQKFVYKEHVGRCTPLIVRNGEKEMKIHPYFVHCYKTITVFLFGAALQQTITNIGKYALGRLRPHFFDICKPDWATTQCLDEHGFYRYVTEDVCTGTDEKRLEEMRLSFPSGHSSLAMYCAVFLTVYLQARFRWKGSKLVTHLCQIIALWLALGVCVSRIEDYKHHWSDVFAGAFLGFIVAYLLATFSCGFYSQPKTTSVCEDIGIIHKNCAIYGTFQPNKSECEQQSGQLFKPCPSSSSGLGTSVSASDINEKTPNKMDYNNI